MKWKGISTVNLSFLAAGFMWLVIKLTPGKQTFKGDTPKGDTKP